MKYCNLVKRERGKNTLDHGQSYTQQRPNCEFRIERTVFLVYPRKDFFLGVTTGIEAQFRYYK